MNNSPQGVTYIWAGFMTKLDQNSTIRVLIYYYYYILLLPPPQIQGLYNLDRMSRSSSLQVLLKTTLRESCM
jgi:hypothetical protein